VRVKHKLVFGLAVASLAVGVSGAGAAAPQRGLLVPGESLGGVRIGMTKADVKRVWGTDFGRCRDCPRTTWYFNYEPFQAEGVGVVFERGRVAHVFTLWQPDGWRTTEGLRIGEPAAEIARTYGPLDRRGCVRYQALVEPGPKTQTVYYVFENEVWAFGLTVREASPCL
jgi:hypothetical protein